MQKIKKIAAVAVLGCLLGILSPAMAQYDSYDTQNRSINSGNQYQTGSPSDETVNGYYRSNGTYVEPYHRTSPNDTTSDNYSTKGNTNPYTLRRGTRNP